MLGGRDCSIQRRHQKLIEEAPPPGLDPAPGRGSQPAQQRSPRRSATGAGTAEFLVDGSRGLLPRAERPDPGRAPRHRGGDRPRHRRAAAARRRRRGQSSSDGRAAGHAIEARLYAEDPRTFLPQAGRIDRLVFPAGIRVDAGVAEGDEIGVSYDPLLAKLIAHGADRQDAIAQLARRSTRPSSRGSSRTSRSCAGSCVTRRSGPAAVSIARSSSSTRRSRRRRCGHPPRAVRGSLAAQPTLAPPAAAPDVDTRRPGRARARGHGAIVAPMPGTVVGVGVAVGRRRSIAAAATGRPRGDEDGDARARTVRVTVTPSTSLPAIRSPPASLLVELG